MAVLVIRADALRGSDRRSRAASPRAWYIEDNMSDRSSATFSACPFCGDHHGETVLVCPNTHEPLPLTGRLLAGKFRFLSPLGEGGMSTVWRAENELVHKQVAIKIMRPEFARNEATVRRFRNEATAAGRIGNAHICDILDLGEADLGLYIVMEMLRGRSFADFIDDQGRIDHGLAVLILRQALVGLAAAHDAGIVHRDLKPDNLFLHEPQPGRLLVKLMDFGISKFSVDATAEAKTAIGVIMGTPEYMSPEQAEGAAKVDARGDIWAIGVMLYHAIVGRNPFEAPTLAATLTALMTRQPDPVSDVVPEVPKGLSDVIMRCLEKKPENRYPDANSLFAALAPFEELPTSGSTLAYTPHEPGASSRPTASPAAANTAPGDSVSRSAPAAARGGTVVAASAEPDGAATSGQPATDATTSTPDGTWSGELAPTIAGEDNWQLRGATVPTHHRPERARSRPLAWLLAAAGVLAGVGGIAYVASGGSSADTTAALHAAEPPADASIDPAGSPETDPPKSTKPDSSHDRDSSPPPANPAATATPDSAGSGSKPTADDSGQTPPPDPAGDAEPAATDPAKPEPSASDKPPPSKPKPSKPKPSKPQPTKPKPAKPAIDQSKLAGAGNLFTPKKAPGTMGHGQAVRHCAALRKKRFAGLSSWRLATPKQAAAFRSTGISKTAYWTNKTSGDQATAFNLYKATEMAKPKSAKFRPLCVARR
ncbi:MAG: hypothetical protein B7733_20445 [Myxococcales bacterium FL481]|nr:MAG: hypothetical protein B7733_20445 [Myxococcales bacterium FL481]